MLCITSNNNGTNTKRPAPMNSILAAPPEYQQDYFQAFMASSFFLELEGAMENRLTCVDG